MKTRIRNPRDFWAGVLFVALGTGFAGIALTYRLGVAARMGPGYFPFYLGIILAALGILISALALRMKNAGPAMDRFHWGPTLWVLGSVVMFGLLLKVVGMLAAGILLVVGSSLGSEAFKLRDVLLLAVGLVVFCSLAFVWGLKLPIPLCPDLEVLQSLRLCRL